MGRAFEDINCITGFRASFASHSSLQPFNSGCLLAGLDFDKSIKVHHSPASVVLYEYSKRSSSRTLRCEQPNVPHNWEVVAMFDEIPCLCLYEKRLRFSVTTVTVYLNSSLSHNS